MCSYKAPCRPGFLTSHARCCWCFALTHRSATASQASPRRLCQCCYCLCNSIWVGCYLLLHRGVHDGFMLQLLQPLP